MNLRFIILETVGPMIILTLCLNCYSNLDFQLISVIAETVTLLLLYCMSDKNV